MTEHLVADRRLYANADYTVLCEEGDVDAAWLLATPGKRISATHAYALKLTVDSKGKISQAAKRVEKPAQEQRDAEVGSTTDASPKPAKKRSQKTA